MSALLSRLLRVALLAAAVLVAPAVSRERRTSWRWYRRALGGRWSMFIPDLSETGTLAWHATERCPGPAHSEILGGEGVPLGACFDERDTSMEYTDLDGNPLDRSDAHECHCEEWPS